MDLARWAVAQVRRFGGVLEHPEASRLWADQRLAAPGAIDEHRGRTIRVDQFRFGHRCEKATRLYVVGLTYPELVAMLPPRRPDRPAFVVGNPRGVLKAVPGWRPEIPKPEREATPPEFARWLVEVARRCRVAEVQACAST
jgi:hypothetical protein